jgi:Mn2+/Fe2+ NRAMP family transporter
MKNIKITEVIVILLVLTVCVCAAVLVAVVGMVTKGSVTVTPEQMQVRLKMIDLLFIMVGIVGTSLGAIIQAKFGSKENTP